MRTHLAYNNLSSVHTHSLVPIPHYEKNDPPSPYYDQSLLARITTTETFTPHNNPPNLVSCVLIEPDSDPSL